MACPKSVRNNTREVVEGLKSPYACNVDDSIFCVLCGHIRGSLNFSLTNRLL